MCFENSHKILEKITTRRKVRCLHPKINIMSTKNNYCGSPISVSLTQLITNLSVILPLIKNSYYEPLFHMKPSLYSNRPGRQLHEKQAHTQADQKDIKQKTSDKQTDKQTARGWQRVFLGHSKYWCHDLLGLSIGSLQNLVKQGGLCKIPAWGQQMSSSSKVSPSSAKKLLPQQNSGQ